MPNADGPTRTITGGRGWYRGDCHVHSQRSSGGELTPEQLVDAARRAGLHFIAITEHNMSASHDAWAMLGDDDLLIILGQEVVTGSGHWLALGLDPGQVVGWQVDDVETELGRVHARGALSVAAHPHAPYPSGTFMLPTGGFGLVEVWNGLWESELPWNADNESALAEWERHLPGQLAEGSWHPLIGSSDVHLADQIGSAQTVVFAEGLNRDAILAGLRAGRSWIAESAAIHFSLAVATGDQRAGMGENLEVRDQHWVARTHVEGVPAGVVSFHTARGWVHEESLSSDGRGVVEWSSSGHESLYVRAEVRHPNGMMAALSNPVFLA